MKAVILAAGIASRLRPLTDHTPKCLLKVGTRSLLERTVDALVENGITELVIVTGYLKEMIESFMTSRYPQLSIEFIHNDRYESTNNIYSLWMTKEAVLGRNVLLLDSDILFDPGVIKKLLESPDPDCLALNVHELGEEEIKVITDPVSGKITEISKTCPVEKAIGESVGIERISSGFLKVLFAELDRMILEDQQVNVFYEAAFENIISQGAAFYPVDITALFSMELDTVEDFRTACEKIPSNLQ